MVGTGKLLQLSILRSIHGTSHGTSHRTSHGTSYGQPNEPVARCRYADGGCVVVKIRTNLGRLADWYGPAFAEAKALARAIEITMHTLFDPSSGENKLEWSLPVVRPSGNDKIHFQLKLENGNWKVSFEEIEAVLSLWLYSVDQQENSHKGKRENDPKDGIKPSLRLLGQNKPSLDQDPPVVDA